MYCPKCGTQNIENASFCRACGANLSLVPQALTGHLPAPPALTSEAVVEDTRSRRERRRDGPPRLDKAISTFFMGLAFIFIAFFARVYAPAGSIWWFWMFIPAFAMIGGGIAEYVRYKQQQSTPLAPTAYAPPAVGPARQGELPPRPASDIYTPTSVTENTTRLLDRDR